MPAGGGGGGGYTGDKHGKGNDQNSIFVGACSHCARGCLPDILVDFLLSAIVHIERLPLCKT